jgi:selenium metabolism protein YedF
LVDNEAARDNVRRFATSQGCEVSVTGEDPDYTIMVTKKAGAVVSSTERTGEVAPAPSDARLVVKISNRFMGTGDEELGRILIKAFIKTVSEATRKPQSMVFYNSGVHLAVEGSAHLEALKALQDAEVDILVCGTCLDFFGLKERLMVGRVSNMFEIIETLSGADRIVSP